MFYEREREIAFDYKLLAALHCYSRLWDRNNEK